MSKQVMISLLDRANNGTDLLRILDALGDTTVSDSDQSNVPTLDVIEF